MWRALVLGMMSSSVGGSESIVTAPLDATVETSNGTQAQLASLWRRPTVLFYEDRDSTAVNQHVKEALFAAGRERGLLEAVSVIAVANVSSYNWFPARNFVLAAVRDVEKRFKLPVYLDFTGSLARAPWNLPARSSTVLLLDAKGVPVRTWRGRLSESDVVGLLEQVDLMVVKPAAPG
jgi:hypothetical protein